MKSFLFESLVIGLCLPLATACSSSPSTNPDGGPEGGQDAGHDTAPVETGPAPCIESQCYTGNKCIADATGVVSCQLPCDAQPGQTVPAGGAGACPFNYTCTAIPAGTPASVTYNRAICTPDKNQYTSGPGLWGTPCKPADGITSNKACDSSQGFWCNAQSPTDGSAYCTTFQCTSDADCRGGWWCATQNFEPNATSNNRRTDGKTITACQPRNYCATCKADVDCDSPTGVAAHCIVDKKGGGYCATECSTDSNCNTEAQCVTLDQSKLCYDTPKGTSCVCAPRARECTGDGKLCAPCLSDADCPNGGLCFKADYSTEHYCAVKSGKTAPVCAASSAGYLIADCPMTSEAPAPNNNIVGCTTQQDYYNPPNYCTGLYANGFQSGQPLFALGCWTPNRL